MGKETKKSFYEKYVEGKSIDELLEEADEGTEKRYIEERTKDIREETQRYIAEKSKKKKKKNLRKRVFNPEAFSIRGSGKITRNWNYLFGSEEFKEQMEAVKRIREKVELKYGNAGKYEMIRGYKKIKRYE